MRKIEYNYATGPEEGAESPSQITDPTPTPSPTTPLENPAGYDVSGYPDPDHASLEKPTQPEQIDLGRRTEAMGGETRTDEEIRTPEYRRQMWLPILFEKLRLLNLVEKALMALPGTKEENRALRESLKVDKNH